MWIHARSATRGQGSAIVRYRRHADLVLVRPEPVPDLDSGGVEDEDEPVLVAREEVRRIAGEDQGRTPWRCSPVSRASALPVATSPA